MSTETLFNLGDRAAALYDELTAERLDDFGAPIILTEEEQSAIIDAYLEAEGKVESKVDAYCALISEFTVRSEARAAEAKRLASLAIRDAKRVDSLESRLHAYFTAHNLAKLETANHSLSIVKNGGKVPVVIVEGTDPDNLDERFQRTIPAKIEIDKEQVRKALEAKESIAFATLGQRGQRLSIK